MSADGSTRLADIRSDGSFNIDSLPSIHTIWYKMAIYCSYKDDDDGQKRSGSGDLLRDCVDYKRVKASVKDFFSAGGLIGKYHLAVYPDVVEELFMDYVDPSFFEASAPPYNGDDCPGYTVFNVVISSIHTNTCGTLQSLLTSINHDTTLLSSMKATRDDVRLCDVATWLVEKKTLGHFDQLGTYLPSGMDIAPGITISQPGLATPATTLHPGQAVKVSIYNFPHGSTINIAILDKSTDPLGIITGDPVIKIKEFDDDGATTIDWRVPGDTNLGSYYLKAMTPLGLVSFSQLVEVVAPGTSKPRKHHRVLV